MEIQIGNLSALPNVEGVIRLERLLGERSAQRDSVVKCAFMETQRTHKQKKTKGMIHKTARTRAAPRLDYGLSCGSLFDWCHVHDCGEESGTANTIMRKVHVPVAGHGVRYEVLLQSHKTGTDLTLM